MKIVITLYVIRQKFGGDLSVCVLNLYPEVNTLPSLVVISLEKESGWSRDKRIFGLERSEPSQQVNTLPSVLLIGVL